MNSFMNGLRLRGKEEIGTFDKNKDASDSEDDEENERKSRRKKGRSGRRTRRSRSKGKTSKRGDDDSASESDKGEDDEIDDEEEDDETKYVDMCCGWAMIPIAATLRGQKKKIPINMCGGTPFALVNIKDEDVKKRPGVWHSLKRAFGFKVKSILEILITPAGPSAKWISENIAKSTAKGAPSVQQQQQLQRSHIYENNQILLTTILPPNIVIPASAVTIVGIFRKLLRDSFRLLDEQTERILPQTGVLHHADPLLSTFPRVLSDPAGSRVLLLLWKHEFPTELNGKNYKNMTLADTSNVRALQVFRNVILHLYHAFSCPTLLPDKLKPFETEVQIQEREKKIKEYIGMVVSQYQKSAVNSSMLIASLANLANATVAKDDKNSNLRKSATLSQSKARQSGTFSGFRSSSSGPPTVIQKPDPNQGTLVGTVVVSGEMSSAPKILALEGPPQQQLSEKELQDELIKNDFNNQLFTPFNTRELMYSGRVFKL
jgi:hypothetical protein